MLEEYIEKLKPFVIELFKNDSSGHDISHLERTMKLSLSIQEKEGGDRIIIGISAFLHDVHRIMQNTKGKFVSPKDSLDTVRKILSNVELTEEQINQICYCIEFHEEYNWNGKNVEDLNTLILQDADGLDFLLIFSYTFRLFQISYLCPDIVGKHFIFNYLLLFYFDYLVIF